MSSSVRLSSVCRLPVTFVHPTQAIEIFGNVSTQFATLDICDPSAGCKMQGLGEVPWRCTMKASEGQNTEPELYPLWNSQPVERQHSTRTATVLVLITNRKSHMSFRLVPKSVILNDLERRNRPNSCVISPNLVAFWADCVKVVEDTRILSAAAKNVVFNDISLMAILAGGHPKRKR